jgi:hypothetical protein
MDTFMGLARWRAATTLILYTCASLAAPTLTQLSDCVCSRRHARDL